MPFNPQTKLQANWCQELLAKFVKEQPLSQNQPDSSMEPEGLEIAQGKWDDDQNLKFIVFIDFHSKIFSSKQKRKSQKIFKTLSKYLGNRTAAQCRSHYQKVMIKFKTIAKLRKHFRDYFGEEAYNQQFKEFVESWTQNHPEDNTEKTQKQQKQFVETGIQTEPMPELSEEFQQMMAMWQMQQWAMTFFSCQYNFWGHEKETES